MALTIKRERFTLHTPCVEVPVRVITYNLIFRDFALTFFPGKASFCFELFDWSDALLCLAFHQSEASIHSQPTAWGLLCLQNSCRAGFIDFSAKFVLFYTFHLLVSEFYVKLRLILEKFVWFEWHGDESKCWSHIWQKFRWQRLEIVMNQNLQKSECEFDWFWSVLCLQKRSTLCRIHLVCVWNWTTKTFEIFWAWQQEFLFCQQFWK